jgi:putative holliday junction resolvase
MRLLGVDFGFKRIGLAVADGDFGVATPRSGLAASGKLETDAEAIAALARKEEVQEIVLGLPLEPEGAEGRMARICRQLAGHLEARGFQVRLVDETLSSVAAEEGLLRQGLKGSHRRKLRDGEAARIILERYLHGEGEKEE